MRRLLPLLVFLCVIVSSSFAANSKEGDCLGMVRATFNDSIAGELLKNADISESYFKSGKLYVLEDGNYAVLDTENLGGQTVRYLFDLKTNMRVEAESINPGEYLMSDGKKLLVESRYTGGQYERTIHQLMIVGRDEALKARLMKNADIAESYFHTGKLHMLENEKYAVLDTENIGGQTVRYLFDLKTNKRVEAEAIKPGEYMMSDGKKLLVASRYTGGQYERTIHELMIVGQDEALKARLLMNADIAESYFHTGKLHVLENEKYAVLDTENIGGQTVRYLFDLSTNKRVKAEAIKPGEYMMSDGKKLLVASRYVGGRYEETIHQLMIVKRDEVLLSKLLMNADIAESYFHTGKLYTLMNGKYALLETESIGGQSTKYLFDLKTHKRVENESIAPGEYLMSDGKRLKVTSKYVGGREERTIHEFEIETVN